MNLTLRALLLASFCSSLSGCITIVLDRAKLDADLSLTPPAVVPDSVDGGTLHGQVALRVSSKDASSNPDNSWQQGLVGGYAQLQLVGSPHVRMVAGGGGRPGSGSLWFGPVWSLRNRYLRWDMEGLLGSTWGSHDLAGHVDDHGDEPEAIGSLKESGEGWMGWGQFAFRIRSRRSGPWGEFKAMPMIRLGVLNDTATNGPRSDPLGVDQSAVSIGCGWIHEAPSGQMLLAGVRMVEVNGGRRLLPSILLAWQRPLFR